MTTLAILASAMFCLLSFISLTSTHASATTKPHILLVLADDYGHGNLGYNRRGAQTPDEKQAAAEIYTPTLDALIDAGVYLKHHYAYKICSPSRSSLQSGRLAVHVNTQNAGVTVQNPSDPVSGYSGIPRNMTGFAWKLREGGYRTHMVGKWDAGMATPEHTPLGRGYETWLGYYQHANDYWRKDTSLSATGEIDNCLNQLTDFANLSSSFHGGVRDAASLSDRCKNDPESDPACYEEHLFKERALEIINKHDLTAVDRPLFLFYAFHLLHSPLQVPNAYLSRIDKIVQDTGAKPIDTQNRRLLAAMILYMDETVSELVEALRTRNMWTNTLVVFMGDNGGAVYEPGSGVNHPLKGGKFSDWEGGVRTNAFVSGGYIPESKRGTSFSGVISIADWYTTFVEFAGTDPTDYTAIEANKWLANQPLPALHPVDGVAQWKFIMNGSNARTGALHLSENAVLRWPYKFVTGKQPYSVWQGPIYPNCTTVDSYDRQEGPMFIDLKMFNEQLEFTYLEENQDKLTWTYDCGDDGCLTNVEADPNEHVNLAANPAYSNIKDDLKGVLADLNKELFEPDRGQPQLAACTKGMQTGGYLGPFVDAESWYSPVHLGIREIAENAVWEQVLVKINQPEFEKRSTDIARLLVPPFRSVLINGPGADKCLSNQSMPSDFALLI